MNSSAEVLRYVLASAGILGAISNAVEFLALFEIATANKMNKLLWRCQTSFDFYACFMIFLSKLTGTVVNTGNLQVDRIFCYLWSYDSAYRLGSILSVQNLIWIAVTRLLSVFCAVFYRAHQTLLITVYVIYLTIVGLINYVPFALSKSFANETCMNRPPIQTNAVRNLLKIHSYIWLMFIFLIPVVCLPVCHFLIIWQVLRKNRVAKTQQQICYSETPASEVIRSEINQTNGAVSDCTNMASIERSAGSLQGSSRQKIKKLIGPSTVLSLLFFVLYSDDAFAYFFSTVSKKTYNNGSFSQQFGLLLMIVFSAVNPFVMFFMIQPLRCVIIQRSVRIHRLFCRVVERVVHSKWSPAP